MNSVFLKILAVCTNWLRRKGCNMLANKVSTWLYNRIDIDRRWLWNGTCRQIPLTILMECKDGAYRALMDDEIMEV